MQERRLYWYQAGEWHGRDCDICNIRAKRARWRDCGAAPERQLRPFRSPNTPSRIRWRFRCACGSALFLRIPREDLEQGVVQLKNRGKGFDPRWHRAVETTWSPIFRREPSWRRFAPATCGAVRDFPRQRRSSNATTLTYEPKALAREESPPRCFGRRIGRGWNQ